MTLLVPTVGWAAGGIGGNDAFTKLLLHMDGSDGSTTFTDSSASAHSITPHGTAQIDTAQSKFGGASGLFDGNSDWLTASASADFANGTGDCTIDFWLRPTSVTGAHMLVDTRSDGSGSYYSIDQVAATIRWYDGGSDTRFIVTGNVLSLNTWVHVACVKSTSGYVVYIDGTSAGTYSSSTYDWTRTGMSIGSFSYGAQYYSGWMEELRVSKGIARWTSNFTPPAEPYS